jgi:phospholipase C
MAVNRLRGGALLDALAPCHGGLADIEHVIILIQENRSFDHYFGTYKGVRGYADRVPASRFAQRFRTTKPLRTVSNPQLPWHINTTITVPVNQGMCTNDVEHQWAGQHDSWNGGKCDRWMSSHVLTEPTVPQAAVAMGYYTRADLPFYYALADTFTICDAYHCPLIGGTDINRLYSMTGTMDPDGWDGGCQFLDTKTGTVSSPGANLGTKGKWIPYPEVLTRAGVSWKVYSDPTGQLGDNVLRYFPQFRPGGNRALSGAAFNSNLFPADFLADVSSGSLPQVSWLLADLTETEHAPAPIEWGESIVQLTLSALVQSGSWRNSAVFLTYDENGGFFDHVVPPTPPTGTPGEYLNRAAMTTTAKKQATTVDGRDTSGDPIGLGFRVPLLVVSPFSRNPNPAGAPMVCSDVFDHTSLLKFLETWTAAIGRPARLPRRDAVTRSPGLSSWRDATVGDLTTTFNFAAPPNPSTPVSLFSAVLELVDPKVLAECTITGTIGSETSATEPLVTDPRLPMVTSLPEQEAGPAPRRPSGPTCPATPLSGSPGGTGGGGSTTPSTSETGVLPITGMQPWTAAAGAAAVAALVAIRARDRGQRDAGGSRNAAAGQERREQRVDRRD